MKNLLTIFTLLFLSCTITQASLLSFDEAMKPSKYYKQSNNPRWKTFRYWYDHNFLEGKQNKKTLIPKIIHHIWLGSPFPEKYKKFQASWEKNHPDWKYRLWTDKDVENLNLVNKKLYNETSNYGVKSDIARYEILYRFGGLYIDTDFECLKSFDIFHDTLEFYAGITYDSYAAVFNGLFASCAGHPILKKCIDSMKSNNGNHYNKNVLEDFFAMTKYTCLIRPQSNFSIVAAKLANYSIEIGPTEFEIKNNHIKINQIEIIENNTHRFEYI